MCLILLFTLILSLSLSSCYAVTTTIQADVQSFVGGDGSNVAGNSDTSTGPGESSLFKSISGISVDTFYNVMCVTDSEAHEVRLVNLPSRFVERLGGVAEIQGYGSGTLTPYYDQPSSCFTTILTDFSDDRVTFVADSGNCMLRYIIGTNSLPLSGPTPPDHQGPRTTPCFNQQDGDEGENVRWSDRIGPIMTTPGKNLLVVDTGAFTLRLVSLGVGTSLSLGATHTVAGTLGISGNNDGIGTSAQFQFPTQFEYIESTSTLYIIDQHRIRMVVIPNNEWDGEWHVTTLGITLPFIPSGIAIDTTTKIMYLTSTSHVLYAVTNYETDPILTVIAGVEGMMGWTNGIGNVARFFDPRDIQLKRDTASTNALLFINDHENHKIRLVNVTVSKSSGASGDPQFVGFQGQSYQVHGQPDEIFNLISSPTLSCNANFVYIQSGKCEYNHTQCWTHPGTYVDALGFRIGTNIADRIKMVAGSYLMGLRIWYNNTEVMVGQEIMMMDGTVMMTRVSYDRVDIITPQFKIGVVNSDSFFNLEIALLDTAALNAGRIRHTGTAVDKYPKFPYHGLIGQTWKNAIYLPSQSYIEGDIDDYRVESHTLFGLDYTYNYFGHEDGEEKMSVI